jgi:hypothetical protein
MARRGAGGRGARAKKEERALKYVKIYKIIAE